MSRWSRLSGDDEDRLLGRSERSGSLSSSSASYYPIDNDPAAAADAPVNAVAPSPSASSAPYSSLSSPAQPYHLPPTYPPVPPPPPTSASPVQPSFDPAAPSFPPSSSPAPSASDSTKVVTLSFRTLSGQVMSVTFPSLDALTVAHLKAKLEDVHGIPVSFQRLIFSGRELTQDDSSLLSYGMEDGSMIHLLLRQNQVPSTGAGASPPVAPPVDSEGMGWFNGISIPIQPPAEGVSEEEAERLVKMVRLSRAIKFLAMISVLGLLIVSMKEPPWMVAAFFGLLGYYGAHQFHARLLLAFFAYIAVSVAARVYFMVTTPTAEAYVVFSFGILLDVYLARLTTTLFHLCKHLTPGERQELMMISRPFNAY